jgi:hypothetical protein
MTTRRFHVGMSVSGAIKNGVWKKGARESLVGCTTDSETGRLLTSAEILTALNDHLEADHRVIPFANCDNWDFQKGCRGHEIIDGVDE